MNMCLPQFIFMLCMAILPHTSTSHCFSSILLLPCGCLMFSYLDMPFCYSPDSSRLNFRTPELFMDNNPTIVKNNEKPTWDSALIWILKGHLVGFKFMGNSSLTDFQFCHNLISLCTWWQRQCLSLSGGAGEDSGSDSSEGLVRDLLLCCDCKRSQGSHPNPHLMSELP